MHKLTLLSFIAFFSVSYHAVAAPYQIPQGGSPKSTGDDNVQLLQKVSKGVAAIAKQTNPALVFVSVYKTSAGMPQGMVDPFEFFFGPRGRMPEGPEMDPRRGPPQKREGGLGSGFFIDLAKGYILTNNHVVQSADEIQLKLANGESYEGKIVGRDPNTDVAVVKVKNADFNRQGLADLPLGNSENLAVGDFVVALGAPFGLEASMSFGIVSAVGRGSLDIARLGNFIQTDAAINPGNSGGPLVDMHGQVVGINTAIYSRSGAYNGIGFTVPSNLVRTIAEQLINNGFIQRGYLGVFLQPVDEELHKGFNLPATVKGGAAVVRVADGGPAGKAGIEPGDVITAVDGKAMKEHSEIVNTIGLKKPGSVVELTVFRDGNSKSLKVQVGQHPDDAKGAKFAGNDGDSDGDSSQEKSNTGALGLSVQSLTKENKQRYNLDSQVGAVITKIRSDSPAARAGLRPGDAVLKIDGKTVKNADEFVKMAKGKARMLLWIERNGEFYFVTLRTS